MKTAIIAFKHRFVKKGLTYALIAPVRDFSDNQCSKLFTRYCNKKLKFITKNWFRLNSKVSFSLNKLLKNF